MNILVNAVPLTNLLTGVSRYVRNLYLALARFPGIEISYFGKRGLSREMSEEVEPHKWIKSTANIWRLPAPVVFSARSLLWLKFEHSLRKVCRTGGFSVFHETGFVPPAIEHAPVVYTIYDLSLIKFRETHPRERVLYFNFFLRRRLPRVNHIITISEFVKSEILEELDWDQEKITTIPLAPDPVFFPRTRAQIEEVLKENEWPSEYVLFVGSMEPRKNLFTLVKALTLTKEGIPLLIAGWEGWGDKEWLRDGERGGLQERIFLTGYTDDETLARLYSGAQALIYPSLYEGFGLPLLEAMACGCPVICSNTSSLPEVAGDAALFVDPNNAEQIAFSIDQIITDLILRESLISKGFIRASQFRWEDAAAKTLEVFRTVSRSKP